MAGVVLGYLNVGWVNGVMSFLASAYTRLFQFVAVPTIALAVTTTLASLGDNADTGRVFRHTLTYTRLTTFAAASVGLVVFLLVAPDNIPSDVVTGNAADEVTGSSSYYDYVLSVIPNNVITPFTSGNVLSVLIISAAVGLAAARLKKDCEGVRSLLTLLTGAQDILFALIRGLIVIMPLGILAFASQFASQFSDGMAIGSIGKYVLVILVSNAVQMFVVLPLFLIARSVNPLRVFRGMSPALLTAFFTKSSASTLPVTMRCAEEALHVKASTSRFVLPICTTINMNGCAAFILVTSLFVMQNAGMRIDVSTMLVWLVISVVSAVGNAGVPMGCYFLTLSLMAGVNAPLGIMGVILPVYTLLDMVETAENVWSDSCVCVMTDRMKNYRDCRLKQMEAVGTVNGCK